ncbi:GTP-binding protein HflX [Thermofilum adornatum 1505]|uniref:GTPase HflX n=1 Tax=Thermofilum adornatum 1505 TaxID=697581 RepID=A0A3G1A590_9CREN|nr:GTPase HflX [Thermofilum adornatum]AJB41118.1 GTP-binding protein HflX [Thermofilum adornatum 1505]
MSDRKASDKNSVVIAGRINSPGDLALFRELRELANAAGYIIVGEIIQKRKREDPKYNIGRGKISELKKLVEDKKPLKIIFLNNLKPSQAYNLAKELGIEVIDRYELILEIFAKRAGSKESLLQIELAKLKRELSFAKEYINLSKRGELHGFLGGGKYAVDSYYTYISSRITKIEEELDKIRKIKNMRYNKRVEVGLYTVSLAGYTGAGKTTLFNTLTNEKGYIDGKPFATLSTLSRKVKLQGYPVIITDTIGFIDSLPESLLDAFYTTLRETIISDVILLVVDLTDPIPEIRRKLSTSIDTLLSLGINISKVLVVGNKIDKVTGEELREKEKLLQNTGLEYVLVSATKRIGIPSLVEKVVEMLPDKLREKIIISEDQSRDLIEEILEKCKVISFTGLSGRRLLLEIEGRRPIISKIKARSSNPQDALSTRAL